MNTNGQYEKEKSREELEERKGSLQNALWDTRVKYHESKDQPKLEDMQGNTVSQSEGKEVRTRSRKKRQEETCRQTKREGIRETSRKVRKGGKQKGKDGTQKESRKVKMESRKVKMEGNYKGKHGIYKESQE